MRPDSRFEGMIRVWEIADIAVGMGLVVTVVRESMTNRVSNPMSVQRVDTHD